VLAPVDEGLDLRLCTHARSATLRR
jgi:hypothetical protein